MPVTRPRFPAVLGAVAAALGLFFSAFSTHDYALHLDRQLHGTHCSFIPGLLDPSAGANPCTAAMYSPYSAIFRAKYWGGVPISLFGLGAYAFFLAASIYLLAAGNAGSKRTWQAYGAAAVTPVLVSAVMFFISLTKLGAFCKLCVGMYVASTLLAIAGGLAIKLAGGRAASGASATDTIVDPKPFGSQPDIPPGYPVPAYATPAEIGVDALIPTGGILAFLAVFGVLGAFAGSPPLVYVSALPDYNAKLTSCGKITELTEKHGALVKIPTARPVKPALMVVDPLCPTCKAFHDRLVSEGAFEKLDVTVAVFPLDSDCNWMLDRALHPGACVLAKAFLCGNDKSREILEWSYANQEDLREAGKTGKDVLRAKVKARFPDIDACIDAKETKQRLDRILQFAVANKLPVSTPQFFLGDTRVCDEDTDLGLPYTLNQLAPEVLAP